jgi:peptidoglycan/LPS O-acetylase OafA/YrhL
MVVAFHTGLVLPGGYLGVDVFFAISGFVIARSLARRADPDPSLDLRSFYARRVRRLLPALAVLTVATTLGSLLVLSPFGVQQRAFRTGAAATVFVANLELYRTTGYFDLTAVSNPFLHTWSLSVEEQLFLVLPLIALVAAGLGSRGAWRRSVLVAVGAGSAVSLVVALAATTGLIDVGQATARLAFFSMPTRLWEFGAGVVAALLVAGPGPHGRRVPPWVAWAGLATIVVAAVVSTPAAVHPGPWAIVVVAATVAVLIGGPSRTTPPGVLSWRPLVLLGDLSYSWYLWHWPALVLGTRLLGGEPAVVVALALGSLVPAWISFRVLERPIGSNPWWTGRRTLALGAGCVVVPLVVLAGAGLASSTRLGLDEPIDWYDHPPSFGSTCHLINRDAVGDPADDCRWGPRRGRGTVMVVGDGLANGLVPGVVDAAGHLDLGTLQRSRAGCPFLPGVVPDGYERCREWQRAVMDEIRALRPAAVVVANQATDHLDPTGGLAAADAAGVNGRAVSAEEWRAGTEDLLDEMEALGVPTILVGPVPDFGDAFPRGRLSLLRPGSSPPALDRRTVESRTAGALSIDRRAASGRPGVRLVDPIPALCTVSECAASASGRWSYLGPTDLTATGARRLVAPLERALAEITDP